MKKAAIGCVLLLVLLAGAATAASYMIYRKASSAVSGFAELGTLPALDRSVRNQTPYVPRPRESLPGSNSSASCGCSRRCAHTWVRGPTSSGVGIASCSKRTAW